MTEGANEVQGQNEHDISSSENIPMKNLMDTKTQNQDGKIKENKETTTEKTITDGKKKGKKKVDDKKADNGKVGRNQADENCLLSCFVRLHAYYLKFFFLIRIN